MERLALFRMRASAVALAMAVAGWAAGCAGPQPMIEPAFAQRTYTPARITILPPAVFMVYDEMGDNDPQKSGALGQAVSQNTVRMIGDELRRRGYQVNVQPRWDGIFDQSGQALVSGYDLGWLANSIVQFANSDTGAGQGPMKAPSFVAPELAQRVGWATQSDALLYVNMKGVVVSEGKRTAQVLGVVFFVVVIRGDHRPDGRAEQRRRPRRQRPQPRRRRRGRSAGGCRARAAAPPRRSRRCRRARARPPRRWWRLRAGGAATDPMAAAGAACTAASRASRPA
jgi:hypothetical protein